MVLTHLFPYDLYTTLFLDDSDDTDCVHVERDMLYIA